MLAVLRNNVVLARNSIERLQTGDTLLLLTPPESTLALDRLFAARAARSEDEVIGDFVFEAGANAGSLAALYGLPVPAESAALTLAELMRKRLGRKPVVGDRADLGPAQLVVAEMEADRITRIGLLLHRRRAPARGTVVALRRRWQRLKRRLRMT